MSTITTKITKGAMFLLQQSNPETTYTPEDFDEETKMLRQAIRDFINKEIVPHKQILDTKKGIELSATLLEKAGDLGFLGLHVPENYGGMGIDFKKDLAASEVMSDSFAFGGAIGLQKGLGIYTILFYGSPEQKEKYLPKIMSAQLKCAYCLTEPTAGSDANSLKATATLSDDGKYYILNGQKMWITNAGFADIFSVFCKIDGDQKVSCLIVEKEWGVQLGAEEKKLGMNGSSNRQVFFENVKVPVENVLGERGGGFKIAMNALNIGRLYIGVAGSGTSRFAFNKAVKYATQRVQFRKTISNFGAIQEKIATMATKMYALESSWNRLGHQIDLLVDQNKEEGMDQLTAEQKAVANFAIECSMLKVFGSEIEQFVIDEALQMHGGMGYSGENDISVLYRNIRGNRIYEGTNEINRLLIPTTLLRKAMKAEVPLMEAAIGLLAKLKTKEVTAVTGDVQALEFANKFLQNCKEVVIMISGIAMQKFQANIKDEQEILIRLSDMLTQVYFFESSLLRATKHQKEIKDNVRNAMTINYMYQTASMLEDCAKEVLYATVESAEAKASLESIRMALHLEPLNLKEIRREIAVYYCGKNEY